MKMDDVKRAKREKERANQEAEGSVEPRIISSREFISEFTPPDYLIDGVVQRRFIYSLTGKTGDGKTAVLLRIAAHTALGLFLNDREVAQGRVLYLAGENPDDIRMRWLAMANSMAFDPDEIAVNFIPGRFDLSDWLIRINR
jgi:RecA-family ATPase